MATRRTSEATRHVVSSVARCDPLEGRPVIGWSSSAEAEEVLRAILVGEIVARVDAPRGIRPRRIPRPIAVLVAILIAGAGVAAASQILGGPAPADVKRDLAGVDQGIPADLRYNPDLGTARLVAQADGASVYSANLTGGGYCSEIVTPDGRAAGAVCVPNAGADATSIHVTVPFVDPVTTSSPMVVGGRINVPGAATLRATYDGGETQDVSLGDDGFFVFAVGSDELVGAHEHGFTLAANDAAGTQIASTVVPPTDFSKPGSLDRKQPIFVSTISTQDDLTQVLGVEGSVNVPGATRLELQYPDGTTVRIPLGAGGHYHYDLPPARTGDLFDAPGWLIARDSLGNELARTPVAAVAYWRQAP